MTVRSQRHCLSVSGGDTLHVVELWPDDVEAPRSMVFSHGAGGSHVSWYAQAAHFSASHRVVLWDHRGFGRSTNRRGSASPLVAALDLEEVLDQVAGGSAHVVAQSMGGWAALTAAARHPEQFLSLTLSDSCAGLLSDDSIRGLRQFMAHSHADPEPFLGSPAVSERFAETEPSTAALYHLLVRAFETTYPEAVPDLIRFPFSGDLTLLAATPVLAIVGDEDKIFAPAILKRDLACIPGIQFEVIAGCGHSPYIEAPIQYNRVLDGFVSTPRRPMNAEKIGA